MIGFDFSTTYQQDGEVHHWVRFFEPCTMKCRLVETNGRGVRITYQRGSKHGIRYEWAPSFEDARRRVTAWVKRNGAEFADYHTTPNHYRGAAR